MVSQNTLFPVTPFHHLSDCDLYTPRDGRQNEHKTRVGYRLNFTDLDSDSAYRFQLFSIPNFDSNVIK